MKKYPSTEELHCIFDYVDGYFYWKIKPSMSVNIGDLAGCFDKHSGYVAIMYKRNSYLMHRLVWIWHGNTLVSGLEIDHINRNRQDNRIENLRQVTRAKNLENQKSNCVCYCPSVKSKNKWKAYTKQNAKSKQIHLGYYETKELALKAVEENERRHSSK
jgi:hypothetical protein